MMSLFVVFLIRSRTASFSCMTPWAQPAGTMRPIRVMQKVLATSATRLGPAKMKYDTSEDGCRLMGSTPTDGGNTNGAAAKVTSFDRLGKKVCRIVRFCQIGTQKVPLSKNIKYPISAEPIRPFPTQSKGTARGAGFSPLSVGLLWGRTTPNSHHKIQVFSDPTLGES